MWADVLYSDFFYKIIKRAFKHFRYLYSRFKAEILFALLNAD